MSALLSTRFVMSINLQLHQWQFSALQDSFWLIVKMYYENFVS